MLILGRLCFWFPCPCSCLPIDGNDRSRNLFSTWRCQSCHFLLHTFPFHIMPERREQIHFNDVRIELRWASKAPPAEAQSMAPWTQFYIRTSRLKKRTAMRQRLPGFFFTRIALMQSLSFDQAWALSHSSCHLMIDCRQTFLWRFMLNSYGHVRQLLGLSHWRPMFESRSLELTKWWRRWRKKMPDVAPSLTETSEDVEDTFTLSPWLQY